MNLSTIKNLEDIEVAGKRVLMRVDFNVPLDEECRIVDDTRIVASLPSIKWIIENGGRLILMSHIGRPNGKTDPKLSLEPVAMRLAEYLESGEVTLTDSCVGDGAKKVIFDLRDGQVAMLENLRFHKGEMENDDKFARELANFGDIFVCDAFGSVHRSHASIVGVPRLIRTKAAGRLLAKEISAVGGLLGEVRRPFVAVLGGAKVSSKIGILENLMHRVNTLIIGGAMANTFIAATGGILGSSLVERDRLPLARDLIAKANSKGVKLLLPSDFIASQKVTSEEVKTVSAQDVPDGWMALDIGPDTCVKFKEALSRAGTIFWNGPMGMFEKSQFKKGTDFVARAIAGLSAFSVVGGGDSVAAIKKAGMEKGFDHISTGGGAALKLLEGKTLPGIAVLVP